MIQAKVVADSKNEFGNRLTTMVVTFPRFILAEFNTHRMFSRNSASSRAIPFEKMVKSVEENPFIPIAWQKDHKGMQGNEYFNNPDINTIKDEWLNAKNEAVTAAKILNEVGITKQLCNRLLEPFMYHTVIVTATEWENFFALRCPQYNIQLPIKADKSFGHSGNRLWRSWKDIVSDSDNNEIIKNATILEKLRDNKGQAEIHMMALAEAMWDVYNESTPKELKAGEWHVPFGDGITNIKLNEQFGRQIKREEGLQIAIKIATARCARVSYTVVGEEGKPDNYENDIKLHDRLLASKHLSPFEHCGRAMNINEYDPCYDLPEHLRGVSGNFKGFIQYRKTIPGENIT